MNNASGLRRSGLLVCLLAGAFGMPQQGRAEELWVPRDYPTIQRAINAAVDGDHVVVQPGVYYEAVKLRGKAITLRSTVTWDAAVVGTTVLRSDAALVAINANGAGDPDRRFVIDGLTIVQNTPMSAKGVLCNGYGRLRNCVILRDASPDTSQGVLVYGGSVTVSNCRIAGFGTGIKIEDTRDVLVSQTDIKFYGVQSVNARTSDNLTFRNLLSHGAGRTGLRLSDCTNVLVESSTLVNLQTRAGLGAMWVERSDVDVRGTRLNSQLDEGIPELRAIDESYVTIANCHIPRGEAAVSKTPDSVVVWGLGNDSSFLEPEPEPGDETVPGDDDDEDDDEDSEDDEEDDEDLDENEFDPADLSPDDTEIATDGTRSFSPPYFHRTRVWSGSYCLIRGWSPTHDHTFAIYDANTGERVMDVPSDTFPGWDPMVQGRLVYVHVDGSLRELFMDTGIERTMLSNCPFEFPTVAIDGSVFGHGTPADEPNADLFVVYRCRKQGAGWVAAEVFRDPEYAPFSPNVQTPGPPFGSIRCEASPTLPLVIVRTQLPNGVSPFRGMEPHARTIFDLDGNIVHRLPGSDKAHTMWVDDGLLQGDGTVDLMRFSANGPVTGSWEILPIRGPFGDPVWVGMDWVGGIMRDGTIRVWNRATGDTRDLGRFKRLIAVGPDENVCGNEDGWIAGGTSIQNGSPLSAFITNPFRTD